MDRIDRELDGVYFRIKRDDKYEDICFSDLTEEEMDSVLAERDNEWLTRMCKILGRTIRCIGDAFDLVGANAKDI